MIGQPDRFFKETQIRRLTELMARWRLCRDEGKALAADDEAELESLIDAELRAAGERARQRMIGGLDFSE